MEPIYIKTAGDLINQGKFKKAKKILISCKSDKNALFLLSRCYKAENDFVESVSCLKNALNIDPLFDLALFEIALNYKFLNKYELAVNSFEIFLKIHPNTYEAYFNLGNLHRDSNNLDLAINAYKKALELNSKDYEIYTNLSDVYITKGFFKEAEMYCQKAFFFNQKDPRISNNAGFLQLKSKNYSSAIQAFEYTLKLDPENFFAKINLGDIYSIIGHHEKALDLIYSATGKITFNNEYDGVIFK
jgi:tetratricopeptide (TPR) repeat protein